MQAVNNPFRALIAGVISRALADLEKSSSAVKTSSRIKDEAMSWIGGTDCETYCLALDVDYAAVRERAAALYRGFLEKADGRGRAPGKPRTVRGRIDKNSCRAGESQRGLVEPSRIVIQARREARQTGS